ncbi:MAG: endonuclease MutS2 [Lactobacillus sp.]|nr:endonuclease MutS2 [Lactobacillus sp.]
MNKRILKTLEYQKIKTALEQFLITAQGQEQLQKLFPSDKQAQVQNWLNETKDGVDILRLGHEIPVTPTHSINAELQRLKIAAILNGSELYHINQILQTAKNIKDIFTELRNDGVNLRALYEVVDQLISLPSVAERLAQSVDQTGKILDDASPELKRIRKTLQNAQQRVRERMEQYLRGSSSKYLSEPIITIREGHLVLPVKQSARNHFGGVVYDQSASGQTVYVEPQSVIALNNTVQEQQIAEKQELQKIMQELSDLLRPYQSELRQNAWLIGQLDLVNAKAKYAQQLRASEPLLTNDNQVDLKSARHPLIDPHQVVPNDIKLGIDYQNLIITGPNTGGKTIALKTVGLLQLMAQSGLFIPAAEESKVAVFQQIFADIGDEQSIEQNLSTFSSHMDNIINILQHTSADSLILLDELGAGTDPQEGAALAIAIIEAFSKKNCTLMVTTHYPELKVFAYNFKRTINASMEFDQESLQPTYRLLIGIPGSSNAFDIANRLGMDQQIVERARQLQSGESQDLNAMIQDLEKQRKNYETSAFNYQQQSQELQRKSAAVAAKEEKLQQQKDQIIDQAKLRANQLVEQSQQQADKIIAQLRQLQQQADTVVKDDQIISAQTQLKKLHHERQLQQNKVLRREKKKQAIKIGDDVHVDSYDQDGVVIGQDKKGNFEVQLGILKMRLPKEQLTKIKPEKQENQQQVSRQRAHSALPLQLDLRGERYEEAMADLDQYIDSALLANYSQVTIVHGFGTGAIRKGVQKYLQSNPRIKKFGYAPANAGGQGATIVNLG